MCGVVLCMAWSVGMESVGAYFRTCKTGYVGVCFASGLEQDVECEKHRRGNWGKVCALVLSIYVVPSKC